LANGHRDQVLDTRPGSLHLRIPKLRQGSYFSPFLEARKVSEKALIVVIQEAWIGGGSKRGTCQESCVEGRLQLNPLLCGEPFAEHDGELRLGGGPSAWRHLPLAADLAQHQEQQHWLPLRHWGSGHGCAPRCVTCY
jgi:Transposase, Mutator family